MIQNKNTQKGIFVISLDLELKWGVLNNKKLSRYTENLLGTRYAIKKILELFDKYRIHATWGVVGLLFFKTKKELICGLPLHKPKYTNSKLHSPYNHIDNIGLNEREDKFHFGHSLIKKIASYNNQEIGTHTFSHYYCLEKGQDITTFEDDLKACKNVAKKLNISLKSLIFPENQFNHDHVDVCRRSGISSYRGDVSRWSYTRNERSSLCFKSILRYVDTYFNFLKCDFVSLDEIVKKFPYNIPTNRFIYAFNKKLRFLETFKLRKIKKEMKYAAKNRLVYHLWWHPHNFGKNTKENLLFLSKILHHYLKMKKRYGMENLNMGEITNRLSRW